jgi:hypothetical protein
MNRRGSVGSGCSTKKSWMSVYATVNVHATRALWPMPMPGRPGIENPATS